MKHRYDVLDYSNNTRDNYWATIIDNLEPDAPQEVTYEDLMHFIHREKPQLTTDAAEQLALDVFQYLFLHQDCNLELDAVLNIILKPVTTTLIKPPCTNGEASARQIDAWLETATKNDAQAILNKDKSTHSHTAIWQVSGATISEIDLEKVVITDVRNSKTITGMELVDDLQWKFLEQDYEVSLEIAESIVKHLIENPNYSDTLVQLMHHYNMNR